MEVLIRIVDKSSDPLAMKRGGIVAICPDNWPWSAEELENPEWRIVRVNILQTTVDACLMVDVDAVTGLAKNKRKYYLNLAAVPNASAFTYTGVRPRPNAILTMTRQQFTGAVVQRV